MGSHDLCVCGTLPEMNKGNFTIEATVAALSIRSWDNYNKKFRLATSSPVSLLGHDKWLFDKAKCIPHQ